MPAPLGTGRQVSVAGSNMKPHVTALSSLPWRKDMMVLNPTGEEMESSQRQCPHNAPLSAWSAGCVEQELAQLDRGQSLRGVTDEWASRGVRTALRNEHRPHLLLRCDCGIHQRTNFSQELIRPPRACVCSNWEASGSRASWRKKWLRFLGVLSGRVRVCDLVHARVSSAPLP